MGSFTDLEALGISQLPSFYSKQYKVYVTKFLRNDRTVFCAFGASIGWDSQISLGGRRKLLVN